MTEHSGLLSLGTKESLHSWAIKAIFYFKFTNSINLSYKFVHSSLNVNNIIEDLRKYTNRVIKIKNRELNNEIQNIFNSKSILHEGK